jgi:hypothetical protein
LGEMYVVHFCNFDWLVKKAWMLLHPAHLTSITQNCTSFLNSPIDYYADNSRRYSSLTLFLVSS